MTQIKLTTTFKKFTTIITTTKPFCKRKQFFLHALNIWVQACDKNCQLQKTKILLQKISTKGHHVSSEFCGLKLYESFKTVLLWDSWKDKLLYLSKKATLFGSFPLPLLLSQIFSSSTQGIEPWSALFFYHHSMYTCLQTNMRCIKLALQDTKETGKGVEETRMQGKAELKSLCTFCSRKTSFLRQVCISF